MSTTAIILKHLIPALQGIQRDLAQAEVERSVAGNRESKDQEQMRPTRRLLKVNEAAEFLRCSKAEIYKLTATKKIPYSKMGSRTLFDFDTLMEWMSNRAVEDNGKVKASE